MGIPGNWKPGGTHLGSHSNPWGSLGMHGELVVVVVVIVVVVVVVSSSSSGPAINQCNHYAQSPNGQRLLEALVNSRPNPSSIMR